MAGVWKVTGQGPTLEQTMSDFSLFLIRLVGLGEALAGLGLVLPAVAHSWAKVAGWAGAILAALLLGEGSNESFVPPKTELKKFII